MGCTREEFLAWLPGATRGARLEVAGDRILVQTDPGVVSICIEQRPARRLGLLSLPVLRVSMRFSGLTAAQQQAFLRHFDFFTRRGGG